jgi:hypothetical protein
MEASEAAPLAASASAAAGPGWRHWRRRVWVGGGGSGSAAAGLGRRRGSGSAALAAAGLGRRTHDAWGLGRIGRCFRHTSLPDPPSKGHLGDHPSPNVSQRDQPPVECAPARPTPLPMRTRATNPPPDAHLRDQPPSQCAPEGPTPPRMPHFRVPAALNSSRTAWIGESIAAFVCKCATRPGVGPAAVDFRCRWVSPERGSHLWICTSRLAPSPSMSLRTWRGLHPGRVLSLETGAPLGHADRPEDRLGHRR